MRILLIFPLLILLSGCTALMLGGGQSTSAAPAARAANDSTIAAAVYRALEEDLLTSGAGLAVSSRAAQVTLTGTVSSYAARARAETIARNTAGVMAVENRIRVMRGQ